MSSTRRAKNDSGFHQNRYASSAEYERGLLANLVAKRCALIESPEIRELIWFVQHLSHQEGGIAVLAKQLVEKFAGQIQTKEMAELKIRPNQICDRRLVEIIREGIPMQYGEFYLRRERFADFLSIIASSSEPSEKEVYIKATRNWPDSYPAKVFFEKCHEAARTGLEKLLSEICLNPESDVSAGPWYFPTLFRALREHLNDYSNAVREGFATGLGEKVSEVLGYTAFSQGLTLMQGEARTGKTFAARAWCNQNPGRARFVEVPAGNDDSGFFRALARGLGLGNFLQYKAHEIRERVESVLHTGDLVLVLDEAQRLWPQQNLRYGFPRRIVWVMSMANARVPIAMVSTPQFFDIQKAVEKSGWNAAQLTGRIKHYEPLPADLSQADLIGVAKAVLPEADGQVLRALAIYARSSARYLAAIDSISTRARYLAMKDGRSAATTADVRKAMQESVIPADNKLHIALELGRKSKRGELPPAREVLPAPDEQPGAARSRSVAAPLIAA